MLRKLIEKNNDNKNNNDENKFVDINAFNNSNIDKLNKRVDRKNFIADENEKISQTERNTSKNLFVIFDNDELIDVFIEFNRFSRKIMLKFKTNKKFEISVSNKNDFDSIMLIKIVIISFKIVTKTRKKRKITKKKLKKWSKIKNFIKIDFDTNNEIFKKSKTIFKNSSMIDFFIEIARLKIKQINWLLNFQKKQIERDTKKRRF